MVDPRLVQEINRGNCFALVGSGPSCELGYPSWGELADDVVQHVQAVGAVSDAATYAKYRSERAYPELFRQAEDDLGSRVALVRYIEGKLQPKRRDGILYNFLTRWPFACYLTTNYDNELAERLKAQRIYFSTLGNRKDDLRTIHATSQRLIVKLHSDLAHPDDVILTSRDYQRLATLSEGQYFRDKLRQIMEMFTILIVGHSITDFDLQLVLQIAKDTADPTRPIYMFASDFTKGQEIDFLEKYNIVVYSYPNVNGTHAALKRLLSSVDRYITPRNATVQIASTTPAEVEAASALLIYRRLHSAVDSLTDAHGASVLLKPLVLTALDRAGDTAVTVTQLLETPPISLLLAQSVDTAGVVPDVLERLAEEKTVSRTQGGYALTAIGKEAIRNTAAERAKEEDAAFGQFVTTFSANAPSAGGEERRLARASFRDALVNAFKARGLAIATAIFAGQSIHPEDLSDIFRVVSEVASIFPSGDFRVAFAIAAHQFILDPTTDQKQYLESVSQGYFLFHLLGLDPTCSRIRSDMFRRTLWIVDSSVILPLLAAGCHTHQFATALFNKLYRRA